MTLDEAIEIKLRRGYELSRTDPRDIGEADRLSIEALKHTQHLRLDKFYSPLNRLPSETKD